MSANEMSFCENELSTLSPRQRLIRIVCDIDNRFKKNFNFYCMWSPYEQNGRMVYKLSLCFDENEMGVNDECIWINVYPFEGLDLRDDEGIAKSSISKSEINSWKI